MFERNDVNNEDDSDNVFFNDFDDEFELEYVVMEKKMLYVINLRVILDRKGWVFKKYFYKS